MTARSIVMAAAGSSAAPPSLDMSFMTPGSLPSGVTFTRASTGTYFNSSGTLLTATTNTPRWDYHPVTHVLRGLLIEEARINIATNSQAVNSWPSKPDTTIVDNSTVSPDGTTNASLATEGSAGTATLNTNSAAVAGSATVSFSVHVKRGNTDWLRILGTDNGIANGFSGWINLATGVSSFTVRGTATAVSGSVTTLTNGWYRIVGIATLIGTSSLAQLTINSATGNGSTTRVNNATYYVWGAQIEVGAFPTSYIPTTAAAATRAIEVCQTPIGAWFTSNATLSFNMEVMLAYNVSRTSGGISDGVLANSLYLGTDGGGSHQAFRAGTGGGTATDGASATSIVQKVCASYNATTMAVCANGGTVASLAITAPALTTATRVGIGNDPWGLTTAFGGWIRRVRYWPRAMSNAELQAVTT